MFFGILTINKGIKMTERIPARIIKLKKKLPECILLTRTVNESDGDHIVYVFKLNNLKDKQLPNASFIVDIDIHPMSKDRGFLLLEGHVRPQVCSLQNFHPGCVWHHTHYMSILLFAAHLILSVLLRTYKDDRCG